MYQLIQVVLLELYLFELRIVLYGIWRHHNHTLILLCPNQILSPYQLPHLPNLLLHLLSRALYPHKHHLIRPIHLFHIRQNMLKVGELLVEADCKALFLPRQENLLYLVIRQVRKKVVDPEAIRWETRGCQRGYQLRWARQNLVRVFVLFCDFQEPF